MTATERIERNETILRGEKPGPTKFQRWRHEMWCDHFELHVKRLARGTFVLGIITGVLGTVAGVIVFFVYHPGLIGWVGAPLVFLLIAYGLGAALVNSRTRR